MFQRLKVMTTAWAMAMVVADLTYILLYLDCALSQLEDDDSVSVSVDLLRRLRNGVI